MRTFLSLTLIIIGFLGSQSYQALCGTACLGQLLWGTEIMTENQEPVQSSCHEKLAQTETKTSQKLTKFDCSHELSLSARHESSAEIKFDFTQASIEIPAFALSTQQWIQKSEVLPRPGPPFYILHQALII